MGALSLLSLYETGACFLSSKLNTFDFPVDTLDQFGTNLLNILRCQFDSARRQAPPEAILPAAFILSATSLPEA